MDNNRIALSICIPTYNRAEYLHECLEAIVQDSSFSEKIEVIVSDNASTDNTQEVGEHYATIYPNIIYSRNSENIHDSNFIKVLSLAHGRYVKLHNDTLRFHEGGLKRILDIIESTPDESEELFFFNNIGFLHTNECKNVSGSIEFLDAVSFMTTWIGNFGCWRKDVELLKDPLHFTQLKLNQVDWFYQLVESKQSVKIYWDNFYDSTVPKKKGGYNLFEVFTTNYFHIIRQHITSTEAMEREKKRLFDHFILQWYRTMIDPTNDTYQFSIEGKDRILLSHYWKNAYFYRGLLGLRLKMFVYTAKLRLYHIIKGNAASK